MQENLVYYVYNVLLMLCPSWLTFAMFKVRWKAENLPALIQFEEDLNHNRFHRYLGFLNLFLECNTCNSDSAYSAVHSTSRVCSMSVLQKRRYAR